MLDEKQKKVLLVIYKECQKDIPNMMNAINPITIGISNDILVITLQKLQDRNLIRGAYFVEDGNSPNPATVLTQDIKITKYGEKYVEEELI